MDFDLTEDQREIKRTARELLAARSPWEAVRAASEAGRPDERLWGELRELGWPGIAVAEEHGGQGLGAVELAVLLEEHGYACAATPFLATATAAAAIQSAGSPEQQARWLPGLASGERTAAVGRRDLVAGSADAAVVVLVDGDGAEVLDGATAGLEPVQTIDGTRAHARLTGGAEGEPLGAGAAERVTIALAAEVVGLTQRALDMTVEYVKERKQFGVPVGSFQAVSHRCAQMLLDTETARSTAYFAAWAADADADADRLAEAAALAGAAAAGGVRDVTAGAIQAHGGIGFTWEADVHWMYKRAQLDAALLGGASRHRAALTRIAASRLAQPAAS